MGPSGCGKTTTLRMLAGLEQPTSGTITVEGKVMNDVPPHHRDTPLVWQSLALFPFLNVVENVGFGLRMRGIAPKERRDRAMLWLDRMALGGFETRRIDQLSGGQRQRVALARSLVAVTRDRPEGVPSARPFCPKNSQASGSSAILKPQVVERGLETALTSGAWFATLGEIADHAETLRRARTLRILPFPSYKERQT